MPTLSHFYQNSLKEIEGKRIEASAQIKISKITADKEVKLEQEKTKQEKERTKQEMEKSKQTRARQDDTNNRIEEGNSVFYTAYTEIPLIR